MPLAVSRVQGGGRSRPGSAGGSGCARPLLERIRVPASAEQGRWDGVLPDCRLLVEWPAEAEAPTGYRPSDLPASTPVGDPVRPAGIRRRIEHDGRELKHGLGLDRFEGCSWPGRHHHTALVTTAHAFLTEQRLSPKAAMPASPSTRSSTFFRTPRGAGPAPAPPATAPCPPTIAEPTGPDRQT